MATSLYDLTVPVLTRALDSLSGVLAKGEAFARDQGTAETDLIEARLAPDMGNLAYQVQRVSDAAKGAVVRLGGIANVAFEDNETSFAELQARIARTRAFLADAPRAAIDGREAAAVTLETPSRRLEFTGIGYVLTFVLPNVYFHVTTAYDILRHRGVPLAKMDYLGGA